MMQKNSTARWHSVNLFIFALQNIIMENDRYKYKKL